ncbi:MAG: methylamine utilization protein [Pirellulaceae bacterium]
MSLVRATQTLCLLSAVPAVLCADDKWTDCRLRIVIDGQAIPAPEPIPVTVDKQGCGDFIADEQLIVDKQSKGIANVVLYVYEGRGGTPLSRKHPSHAKHDTFSVRIDDCIISPRVICIAAGDDLVVKPDQQKIGHNLNIPFFANSPSGPTTPPLAEQRISVDLAEPGAVPIQCNIHPWMKAYLVVLEHRYVGVSNRDGVITIKNLPVGETLAFRLYHETVRFVGLPIKENTIDRRSLLTATIREGINDLGEIRVPLDAIDLD